MDNTSWQVGTLAFSQSWNGQAGVWDGYATLPGIEFDLNAYNHFTFSLSDSDLRCAIGPLAIQEARNSDHVLWLDFKPQFTGPATWSFMVHADLVGHALGVAQPVEGGGPPVVSPLSLGSDWFSAYRLEGGGSPFYGVRASAPVDPAKPFWVVDFTTGLRAPAGATYLREGWLPDTASYPLVSVSIHLDANSAGDRFTLHWQSPGQPEMVQSLLAAPGDTGWQQMGNWAWEDLGGTVSVTGSVALGANYWLTRDSDGWTYDFGMLDPFAQRPDPLRWSLRGMAAPPVQWQTVTFHIATGYGWSAGVVQPGGMRSLSPTYSGTFTLPDADEWGNPHDFYYEEWTAQIDPREPYWLSVSGTQLSYGDTWFFNGWTAMGGAPRDMQSVTFGIESGFRWISPYVSQSSGSQNLTLSGEGYQIQDFTADGTPNDFHYDLWNATVDVNRPYFLTVNGTTLDANQTWFTNGWQWQGGSPAPQNWQTLYFTIASGCGWWGSYVTQGNNSWALNYSGTGGYIEDYWNDGSGTPNFFYYDVFSANVNLNLPFTLTVNGQQLAPGDTTFYNGWTWQGGQRTTTFTLNLTVPSERASHDFTLTAPDGASVTWTPNGWTSWQWISLYDPWRLHSWGMWGSLSNISQTLDWNGSAGSGRSRIR